MRPVGDLGGAVGPEMGCAVYWLVVGTSGACRDIRWDIRRRWRGPWRPREPPARPQWHANIMKNQWKSLKNMKNHWKPSKTIENQWKSIVYIEIFHLKKIQNFPPPSSKMIVISWILNRFAKIRMITLLEINALSISVEKTAAQPISGPQRLLGRRQALWQKKT